jgi:hypothetical protein
LRILCVFLRYFLCFFLKDFFGQFLCDILWDNFMLQFLRYFT